VNISINGERASIHRWPEEKKGMSGGKKERDAFLLIPLGSNKSWQGRPSITRYNPERGKRIVTLRGKQPITARRSRSGVLSKRLTDTFSAATMVVRRKSLFLPLLTTAQKGEKGHFLGLSPERAFRMLSPLERVADKHVTMAGH